MATAYFNRQIYSTSKGDSLYYLDTVITKGFLGPYTYNFFNEPPFGVSINMGERGYYLLIPSGTTGSLTISTINKENKESATTTTDILIDGSISFINSSGNLINKSNFGNNLSDTKKGWSSIVGVELKGGTNASGPSGTSGTSGSSGTNGIKGS